MSAHTLLPRDQGPLTELHEVLISTGMRKGEALRRPDGPPLRPEYVLRHFYDLTEAVGVPRIRVHDLRHLAATIMIASGVPLAMVSTTLRHSTLSTTVDAYGHPTRQAVQDQCRVA